MDSILDGYTAAREKRYHNESCPVIFLTCFRDGSHVDTEAQSVKDIRTTYVSQRAMRKTTGTSSHERNQILHGIPPSHIWSIPHHFLKKPNYSKEKSKSKKKKALFSHFYLIYFTVIINPKNKWGVGKIVPTWQASSCAHHLSTVRISSQPQPHNTIFYSYRMKPWIVFNLSAETNSHLGFSRSASVAGFSKWTLLFDLGRRE